ncbi:MAG: hypothetical protein AAFU54_03235 [Chloroflexota bacterium]
MPIEFEHVENEPLLIAVQATEYDPAGDAALTREHLQQLLDNHSGQVYYIPDVTGMEASFSDLVVGLAESFNRKQNNNIFFDPRLHILAVATNPIVKLAAKAGAQQDQYGNARLMVFDSREEALAYAREQVALYG